MKTIGMLGGMSWESTATYYRELNQGVKNALDGVTNVNIKGKNLRPLSPILSLTILAINS